MFPFLPVYESGLEKMSWVYIFNWSLGLKLQCFALQAPIYIQMNQQRAAVNFSLAMTYFLKCCFAAGIPDMSSFSKYFLAPRQ